MDSCGNRNPLNGNIHQTILLNSTTDTCQKTCTLNWSHYEGWAEIEKYYILRYNAPDQILLDSVNGSINSYTVSSLDRIIPYSFFVRAKKKGAEYITSASNTTNAIPYFRIEPSGQYISNVSRENNSIEITIEQNPNQNKLFTKLYKNSGSGFSEIEIIPNTQTSYTDIQVQANIKYKYQAVAFGLCNNVFDTSNISGNMVLSLTDNDPVLSLSWNGYSTWNKGVKEYVIHRASAANEETATNFMAWKNISDTAETDIIDRNQAVCYYIEAIENNTLIKSKSNIECLSYSGEIFWPNAISPNGVNKEFQFYGTGINPSKTSISIFNRWGELVFQTSSLQQAWDGTDTSGTSLPMGTYYFIAQVSQNEKVFYCLEKHLENCLPLFMEAIEESVFPNKALETLKRNAIQKLKVNEKKNSFVCRRAFAKNIYGENHPYGKANSVENIQSINREELVSFHQNNILAGFKYAILSGKFSHETLSRISNSISLKPSVFTETNARGIIPVISPGKYFIEKNDSVQAAIRIGKHGLQRTNPDFASFQLLNLIFGGYFGSRIMKNIREEKGLTYGIYSSHEINQQGSTWYIETEINSKSKHIGVEEIYKEMKILREVRISEEEIDIARNYLLGSILKSLDNTLSLSNRMKLNLDFGLQENYLGNFIAQVNKENADSLIETAQKYFTEEGLVEMIAGKN